MAQTQSTAAWRGRALSGVLFDLDGTLLDTVSDIARALNRALGEYNLAPLPIADVSRMIGRGSPILIELATAARGRALGDGEKAAMLERFFHHYGAMEEGDESDAQPYAGAGDALRILHDAHMRIAVVTNKHHRFASALLQRLNLMQWIGAVVGGDTCERRKPIRAFAVRVPIIGAIAVPGPDGGRFDQRRDGGARRRHSDRVRALWVQRGRDPRSLACDAMIETLADLPGLLWPED